jgi:hypothetical protein
VLLVGHSYGETVIVGSTEDRGTGFTVRILLDKGEGCAALPTIFNWFRRQPSPYDPPGTTGDPEQFIEIGGVPEDLLGRPPRPTVSGHGRERPPASASPPSPNQPRSPAGGRRRLGTQSQNTTTPLRKRLNGSWPRAWVQRWKASTALTLCSSPGQMSPPRSSSKGLPVVRVSQNRVFDQSGGKNRANDRCLCQRRYISRNE